MQTASNGVGGAGMKFAMCCHGQELFQSMALHTQQHASPAATGSLRILLGVDPPKQTLS
jgi:hypothetical protein